MTIIAANILIYQGLNQYLRSLIIETLIDQDKENINRVFLILQFVLFIRALYGCLILTKYNVQYVTTPTNLQITQTSYTACLSTVLILIL